MRPWVCGCGVAALLLLSSCTSSNRKFSAKITAPVVPEDTQPSTPSAPAQPVGPPPRAGRVKNPPGDQPDKAAAFYILKRAGEGAQDLPFEKYEAAREKLQSMPVFSLSQNRLLADRKGRPLAEAGSIDLGGWQPLGPGNQGGRTRNLLIHPGDPSIMYAGGATGGVWKTTDAGRSWRALTDAFPSLGIGALAFEPGNPDTIYVGTGFWFNALSGTNVYGSAPRGGGIFRSRDAGATWEKLPDTDRSVFRYVNEIIVSRSDPNRIYVATWAGIHRTTDGGSTWQLVVNRSAVVQDGCQDMVMRTDQQTDYLFAACGTTPGASPVILRNTDAGGSGAWTQVFSDPAMGNTTLALAPSNQDVVYALIASNGVDSLTWRYSLLGVWRSSSGGDRGTWEARVTNQDADAINTGLLSTNSGFYAHLCNPNGTRSIGGQGWIHNAIAVDPQDPDKVFAAGIDIYRSDDGGRTWGIASFWQAADGANGAHADVLGLIYTPDFDGAAKPHLYAVTDGGVYLTRNSRAALATGTRAACVPPYTNQVTWQPLHGGYQSTQFYTGTVLPGGGAYFGGKQDNGTMRGTLAGGGEWVRLRGGDGAGVAFDRRDPNTLFVSAQNFSLARSRDGGRTLALTTRGITEPSGNFSFIAPLAMDPTNPDRLYAGGRTFYRTDNQADLWTPISTQLPTAQGSVTAIAVSPADPTHVIFATSQGYLFRAANAQEANETTVWDFVRPRPGFIPSVAFDPADPNVAYAVYSQFNTDAGQSHVYRTSDGGASWTGMDGSGDGAIPDMPVLSVMVDPLDSSRIYLGTDLGVFVSTDGGGSWSRDQSPFATVPTESLVLERGSGPTYLYAFTFGRGVWRTMLPGTGEPCEYRVTPTELTVAAIGGQQEVTVETGDQCSWTALRTSGTFDVSSPAAQTGTGKARFLLPLQTATSAARFTMTIQDKNVNVTQRGASTIPLSSNSMGTPATVAVLPFVGIIDTRTATAEATDPTPSCAGSTPPAKTIWLRVTPQATGTLEIYFEGRRYDVFGSSGLIVSAYQEAAGVARPDIELGCATVPRNTTAWIGERIQVPAKTGSPIWVQVAATGATAVDGGFTIISLEMLP